MRPRRNFTKFWFYRYGPSCTAHDLAKAVNGKLVSLEGSVYRKRPGQILINWGNSHAFREVPDLNHPEAVAIATSKLRTFDLLARTGVPIPEVTVSNIIANQWAAKEKVVARDLDNGRGGKGITLVHKGERVPEAVFYTRYFRKNREFRIHVFQGKVIFEQEKLKKKGDINADKYIRSHDRGWCFAFNHLAGSPVPDAARDAAVRSVLNLGLDFGAVDLGWNRDVGVAVFEVNTAPGLEESSLKAYAEAICGL